MKVSELRKSKNMTQTEVARLCETTQQQIAKIEGGSVDPKLSTLRRLADCFDCELKDLFWTKKEFLAKSNNYISSKKIRLKEIQFINLAHEISQEYGISSYHPFWEKVEISGNKLQFKEEKCEEK